MWKLQAATVLSSSDRLLREAGQKKGIPRRLGKIHSPLHAISRGMTYSCDSTAISEIISQPVNAWSAELQHVCEAKAVLAMSKEQRNTFYGQKDEIGKTVDRGIVAIRGAEAAEDLKALMERLQEVRGGKS